MIISELLNYSVTIEAIDVYKVPFWLFVLLSLSLTTSIPVGLLIGVISTARYKETLPPVPDSSTNGEECIIFVEVERKVMWPLNGYSGTFSEVRKATIEKLKIIDLNGKETYSIRYQNVRKLTAYEMKLQNSSH